MNYLHGDYYPMKRVLVTTMSTHSVLQANNLVKTCSSSIGKIVVSKTKNDSNTNNNNNNHNYNNNNNDDDDDGDSGGGDDDDDDDDDDINIII